MLNLNFTPFPELSTERLVLRQLEKTDADDIFSLRSNEDVNKYLDRPKAISVDDAVQFIHKINDGINKNEWLYWAINLKESNKLIGTICLWNIEPEKVMAETGYELFPEFQGRGIMQEALLKVIEFGFENLQLNKITAFPDADNKKSIQLLEKNTFKRDLILEDEHKGKLNNLIIYSLVKS